MPEDLAREEVERDVAHPAAREPADARGAASRRAAGPWSGKTSLSSRPTIRLIMRCLSSSAVANVPTMLRILHHRRAVGEREHLLEPVRDVDHADAVVAELAGAPRGASSTSSSGSDTVGSSMIRSLTSRASARPIITRRCSAGESDPAGRRRSACRPSRSPIARRSRERLAPAARARPRRVVADEHVLGGRQRGGEGELLRHDLDAELTACAGEECETGAPLPEELRRRRAGRCPATIFISVDLPAPFSPIEAEDLALAHVDRDAVERADARERLLHVDAPGAGRGGCDGARSRRQPSRAPMPCQAGGSHSGDGSD